MEFIVIIPFGSFIGSWDRGKEGSLDWLLTNIGQPNVDWKADTCKEVADCAIFWFKREEDTVAFKLRWS